MHLVLIRRFFRASRSMAAAASTNRLINERSPYLLQHAHNPVDWYPWGDEAFNKAKELNRLIFLSVGYSTCHWCHVMEHESFENSDIAEILNNSFVSIKVDREERPDVDKLYMTYVQVTSGSGGWPMSVFLTPDLMPIFGGTYFPPDDSFGRIGFRSLLNLLAEKWRKDSQLVSQQGTMFSGILKAAAENKSANIPPAEGVLYDCYRHYATTFDEINKGFGTAPKFPHPVDLDFLLNYYAVKKHSREGDFALKAVAETLKALWRGGIHDHVGKGFHRYSVDASWHVPHFEKMLYDQAQLISVFSNSSLITGELKEAIEDIADYVFENLTHKFGGFYSAEDADSFPSTDAPRKREGAFCVWTEQEINASLKGIKLEGKPNLDLSQVFKECFHVKSGGNVPRSADQHNELTGQNVLIMKKTGEEIASKFNIAEETLKEAVDLCKKVLLEIRKQRPKPHLDNKMLTSWNGLMISGLARASIALKRIDLAERAMKAVDFIKKYLYAESDENLLRCAYVDETGEVTFTKESVKAFADDYAFLIQGLLDLYECTFDESLLIFARQLQAGFDKRFWDMKNNNGYFLSEEDPAILVRMKEDQDGAEPTANSVAALNLLRLADIFNNSDFRRRAQRILEGGAERLKEYPYALPKMVTALTRNSQLPVQIIVIGSLKNDTVREMVLEINSHYIPNKCFIVLEEGNEYLLNENENLKALETAASCPTVYICKNTTCSLPITDVPQLKNELSSFD